MSNRSHTTTSPPAFDLEGVNLDALSDHEAERLLFADEPDDASSFWSFPTMAGLSIISLGIVYLLAELDVPLFNAFSLDFLIDVLPIFAGVLIILIGFGVISERPSRKTGSRAASSPHDATPENEDAQSGGLFDSDFFSFDGRITRSRSNRKVAGVCGGLADYLDVDPTLIRIGFVIGLVATGGNFFLAYLVLAYVIPKEEQATPRRVRVFRDR